MAIEDICGCGGLTLLALWKRQTLPKGMQGWPANISTCPNKRQGLEAEVQRMCMFAFWEGEAVASQPLLWLHLNEHVSKSGLSNVHRLNEFANPL